MKLWIFAVDGSKRAASGSFTTPPWMGYVSPFKGLHLSPIYTPGKGDNME